MRSQSVVGMAVTVAVAALFSCGGGGGGSNTANESFTVSGAIYTTTGEAVSSAYTAKLTGANVTFCKPTPSGIEIIGAAPATRSTASGGYTLHTNLQVVEVERNQPLFICASHANGTYTLTSMIPPELVTGGAALSVNVTPGTTMIGWMACPGGRFPPANGPCFTTNRTTLENLSDLLAGCYAVHGEDENGVLVDSLYLYAQQWLSENDGCFMLKEALRQAAEASGSASPDPADFVPQKLPVVPTTDETSPEPTATPTTAPTPTPTPTPTPEPAGSPYEGSWSGQWSGSCPGFGNVGGDFSVDIAGDGSVTGKYQGDESGVIDGDVAIDGTFRADGVAGGDISWWGTFKATGASVGGSGHWSEPILSCAGDWSVP